jgi:CO/xanthine dehydrogenase FAD-binding subunit
MTRPAYYRPATLAEALEIRAERAMTVLAGGTDVYPARTARIGRGDMRQPDVLDITAIGELKGISEDERVIRFGEGRRSEIGWRRHANRPGTRRCKRHSMPVKRRALRLPQ